MSRPPSEPELGELQARVLDAVLRGTRLPGASTELRLPDAEILLAATPVPLLAENLHATPERLAGLPVEVVEHVTEDTGVRLSPYLRFGPARVDGDDLHLALEVRVRPRPDQGELGLGTMLLQYRRANGSWELVNDPVFLAS